MSRLSLIDLAGSEQATSQTERRSEGAFINKRCVLVSWRKKRCCGGFLVLMRVRFVG